MATIILSILLEQEFLNIKFIIFFHYLHFYRYTSMSIRNYDFNSGHLDLDQEDIDEKVDKFEANSREVLMKLFMFSCKNSREQRAYEVASIMDATALQLAVKYATKTRALVLAQNLNMLAEKKATLEYEKERMRMEQEQEKGWAF